MFKPFDLEAAKAGKKFKRVTDPSLPHEKVQDKTIIGVSKRGLVVWEYTGSYMNDLVFNHKPEELEMVPEKKEEKFLLVSQPQVERVRVYEDTPGNRSWVKQYKYLILKEFTVEWE